MRAAGNLPTVSIVTPALQAAEHLEGAIESILAQDHPHVDYLVVDGGSTDGTLDLLRSYGDHIRWTSGPDRGQAHAVNLGLRQARGTICGFLNADDRYLPGAISAAVEAFGREPDAAIVFGRADLVDGEGRLIEPYPVGPTDHARLARGCTICQPAAFFSKAAFQSVGGLDERLHLVLDYDLWLRMTRHSRAVMIDSVLATSSMRPDTKTLSRRGEFFAEFAEVYEREYGRAPAGILLAAAAWRRGGGDGFFVPYRHGPGAVAEALVSLVRRDPVGAPRSIVELALAVVGAKLGRRQLRG